MIVNPELNSDARRWGKKTLPSCAHAQINYQSRRFTFIPMSVGMSCLVCVIFTGKVTYMLLTFHTTRLVRYPSRFFFCDLVVLEPICYRMRACQLTNESNTTGRLKKKLDGQGSRSALPVQIFMSPPVVLLSFVSRVALVRCQIDSNMTGSKKKIWTGDRYTFVSKAEIPDLFPIYYTHNHHNN